MTPRIDNEARIDVLAVLNELIDNFDGYPGELIDIRDAVTQLVEVAKRLEVAANTVAYCYTNRPENFAAALTSLRADSASVNAILRQIGERP